MNYKYNFEKLEIWNLAIDLSLIVYELTSNFPSDEKFGITNQIRRASTSISANIAEGSSRSSLKKGLDIFKYLMDQHWKF